MAAIGAKLVFIGTGAPLKGVYAYNFDTAQWEWLYETGLTVFDAATACWDGAYHIWFQINGDYHYRLNMIDYTISAFLADEPDTSYRRFYTHDYDGLLYASGNGNIFRSFDHGVGDWADDPNPGVSGVSIVVPPSAVEQPGMLFHATTLSQAFKMYNPATGVWANKLNAPGNMERGDIVWANEFVFTNQGGGKDFYKYNVNANTWATVAARSVNAHPEGQHLTWDYDDNGYIYWFEPTGSIYRYDIGGDSWSGFATVPGTIYAHGSLVYVPRIRYLFLNSSGEIVANPMNLGAEFSGETGSGVLYYVKALETVGATTLAIEADARTDADDLLDIAADNNGVPGAWGNSVALGAMAENGTVPFWIRVDASGAPTTQPRCARLKLTT